MTSNIESNVAVNKSHVELLGSLADGWMLRQCSAYYDELTACRSVTGRSVCLYCN